MGYSVYEDRNVAGRWAGYAVPAECDLPDCTSLIDRGMAYLCENEEGCGCGFFFCSDHLYSTELHDNVVGKPDHPSWMYWILHHHSWERWRAENPGRVLSYQKETQDFVPSQSLLEDLKEDA